jgi:hypothetical protein
MPVALPSASYAQRLPAKLPGRLLRPVLRQRRYHNCEQMPEGMSPRLKSIRNPRASECGVSAR